ADELVVFFPGRGLVLERLDLRLPGRALPAVGEGQGRALLLDVPELERGRVAVGERALRAGRRGRRGRGGGRGRRGRLRLRRLGRRGRCGCQSGGRRPDLEVALGELLADELVVLGLRLGRVGEGFDLRLPGA